MSIEIEDRIYELQYFTGYRITDEENPIFSSVEEVAPWFAQRIQDKKDIDRTIGLHIFEKLKHKVEELTGNKVSPSEDLNGILNNNQKQSLYNSFSEEFNIQLTPMTLPPALINFLVFLSAVGIFGGLLFSTYAVFSLLWSGWIFLTPLIFLILTLLALAGMKNSKSYIAQQNLVDLAHSTHVIEKQNLNSDLHLSEAKTLKIINNYLKTI